MKKLLSLALVLTMLFTIIAVPSVSAATEDIVLVEADLANSASYEKLVGKGTDAWTGGKSAKASRSGTSYTYNGTAYTNTVTASLTTSTAVSATHPGVASVGSDVPLIEMTQTAIASIYRMFFADGDLSVQSGDKLSISFKFYADDPYTTPATTAGAGTKSSDPISFEWNFGFANASSSGQGDGVLKKTYTTGQWYDINLSYDVNDSNIATYKKIYGLIAKGTPNFNTADGVTSAYPGTMYITAPVIKVTRTVASNSVAVTADKLGEGTVTGAGEYDKGATATLTAAPATGYVFEGWYNASTNILVSKDASYSFTCNDDASYYAYFIPAAVNGYNLLSNVNAEDGWKPSTNYNFWGQDDSTKNGNSDNMAQIVTYEDEAAAISKPNTTEDFGSSLIKADKANQPTADTGVGTFRINGIEGVRYNAGDAYRISAWIYVAEMDDDSKTSVPVTMKAVYNASSNSESVNKITVPVGEWTKVESTFIVAEDSNLVGSTSTGWRAEFGSNYVTVMYLDNFKIEKLDGVAVTAEATNGTVYGTGVYEKGSSVTLNAGANPGYKFSGYYTKTDDTLISANPTYTFKVTANTTVVAKFVKEDAFTYPSNVIYHFGNEEGDVGENNNWMYLPTDTNGAYKQDSTAPYNAIITYHDLAADGIYKPYESAEFGAKLYQQKRLNGDIKTQVSGRFRGWENGSSGVSTKYKAGKSYKFTWWVYPVSMQLANGETAQPTETKLTVKMQYSSTEDSGLEKDFTLNVGEWNKLEWEFEATETMTTIAPGLRYDWKSKKNGETELLTVVNWALYDEIQVEQLEDVTSWQYGDKTAPSNWYDYLDQNDLGIGASNNNIKAASVVTYDDAGIAMASDDAGDYVVKMDYSKPAFTEASFDTNVAANKVTGDYEGMTYDEAYAHLTRLDNWGGDLSFRFKDIVAKGILTLGNTYKISIKVYIAEKKNIKTGAETTSNTNVRIIGTRDGQSAEGDGKNVVESVPFGQWTEVSYTFKATEAGVDFAPSLKVELKATKPTEIPTIVYIDDVRVDQVHADNFDLEIKDGGTTVTATASVIDIKSGNTKVNAVVIIAAYDEEGKLVGVELSNNGVSTALAINDTLNATYTKTANDYKYVAFVWNNLEEIRPYVVPAELFATANN